MLAASGASAAKAICRTDVNIDTVCSDGPKT